MDKAEEINTNTQVYYRLVALWVVCEAFLGGMIHGLKLPVSGLIVGSSAVFCICLIGYYSNFRGAILKATVIVAVCKMMLSPQAPPAAYIAVFFQGLMGQLLFSNKRYFKVASLLLGFLSLVESALQRILVMTILYGNDLWSVVNEFIIKVTGASAHTNYSWWLVGGYIFLHAVVGLLVGWFASIVIKRSQYWNEENVAVVISQGEDFTYSTAKPLKKRTGKLLLFIIWIVIAFIFLQSYFNVGEPLIPSNVALQILLRSVLILLTWYFLLSPIIKRLMTAWLEKKKASNFSEIQDVLHLLPTMLNLVKKKLAAFIRI